MKEKSDLADILIPADLPQQPEPHEIKAAQILANHFGVQVSFVRIRAGYKTKTPDVMIAGVVWEIKSPTGNSIKSTIKRQFKGLKQSRSLIIYTVRTKLDDILIIQQVKKESTFHRIDRIKIITKTGRVIDIL